MTHKHTAQTEAGLKIMTASGIGVILVGKQVNHILSAGILVESRHIA